MPDSYVAQLSDLMDQLLWTNILREYVAVELVALPLAIPVVGGAISAFLALDPVQAIILKLIESFVAMPLFTLLVRWGVFTSVDWKEDAIYDAYQTQAQALLPTHGTTPPALWTPEQDKAFSDAADNLIELHVPGWNS